MPIDLMLVASLAAIISAMADVFNLGISFGEAYERRQQDPELGVKARVLAAAFSTFSDEEMEAIADRIRSCRDQFVSEGSGSKRVRCLCSVLSDVKVGNGGTIPVDDWADIYEQLNCEN